MPDIANRLLGAVVFWVTLAYSVTPSPELPPVSFAQRWSEHFAYLCDHHCVEAGARRQAVLKIWIRDR